MLDTFLATYTLAQADESGAPTLSTGSENAGQNTTATTGAESTQNANQKAAPQGGFGGNALWLMILVLGVFWIFMLRSSSKDKKKKQQLLASMKKGSKVQTIGGIMGTIVDIRDDIVVVKIDESTNTRMRVNRSAIQTVIEDKD